MTDLRKAAEMALDALEKKHGKWGQGHDELNAKAMNALRQALAQPEQDISYTDIQMAELIMSDCGHSSDYTPLLDRIAGRLATYRQAQPEQEPTLTEKDGSPCPEFWDWLPKAYNFEGLGEFTKYNMEVAFLAGKNTALAQPEQEPVAIIERNSAGQIYLKAPVGDHFDMSKYVGMVLYAGEQP